MSASLHPLWVGMVGIVGLALTGVADAASRIYELKATPQPCIAVFLTRR